VFKVSVARVETKRVDLTD